MVSRQKRICVYADQTRQNTLYWVRNPKEVSAHLGFLEVAELRWLVEYGIRYVVWPPLHHG